MERFPGLAILMWGGFAAAPGATLFASDPAVAASLKCAVAGAVGIGIPFLDYGPRGNRCEGVFRAQVSTSLQMRLVSFHRGRPPAVRLPPQSVVGVRVLGAGPDTLLSARSTRPRVNYVMDTKALAAGGLFRWDTRIVSAPQLALAANELGFLACNNDCRLGAATIYLPVQIDTPLATAAANRYALTLVSRRKLDSLRYQLAGAGGAPVTRTTEGRSNRAVRLRSVWGISPPAPIG
jgi:hypothetical protein